MITKFNLKTKIGLTISFLKFILLLVVVFSILAVKFIGPVYLGVLLLFLLPTIILTHRLSGMIDTLLNKHVSNVIENNTLISSNVLDAILSQDNFIEKNNLM